MNDFECKVMGFRDILQISSKIQKIILKIVYLICVYSK